MPDTCYKNTQVTDPHGVSVPIQWWGRTLAVKWMAVLHLTADTVCCPVVQRCPQHSVQVLLWQQAHPLPLCCAAHTFSPHTGVESLPTCCSVRKGWVSSSGWSTTAQWGADAVAAPLPWAPTASSVASWKLDSDVSGNRKKDEPTESVHMF